MGDALELFEPGEYLDTRGPGYFSILTKNAKNTEQHSYELTHLATVVRGLNPNVDSWISQATFSQPNHRAVNLHSVGLIFADLDTYRIPRLQDLTPEELAIAFREHCVKGSIPPPSIVLFSGRGLQAKWILDEALGPSNLVDWNHLQSKFVKAWEEFGGDQNAKDISRVLRVDQTINSKSGLIARVVLVTRTADGKPVRYDFKRLYALMEERYPDPSPIIEIDRGETVPRSILRLPESHSLKRLNWYRLHDLQDLWKLRGGVPKGWREVTLFWELNFMLRAEPVRTRDIWKEAQALAGQIDPCNSFYHQSDLSTLYGKAQAMQKGETVEYNGKRYPPLYTPRNTTLIERFEITSEEQTHLRTIISRDERNRRRTERRRAAGVIPREAYERNSLSRQKPWEQLGISRQWWYRIGKPSP